MAKQAVLCKQCNKPLILVSSVPFGPEKFWNTYECGHSTVSDVCHSTADTGYSGIVTKSGFKPFKYQVETAQFVEEAGFRAGIFHEQGLGKTICSLLPIITNPEKLLPCVILAKAGLVRQWAVQAKEWLGDLVEVQIINNGTTPAFSPDSGVFDLEDGPEADLFAQKGPNVYVISMDSLKSNDFIKNGIPWAKYIIIDECQAIKNAESKRSQAVQHFVRGKEHIVALSGTPFKNNASEYFPILNILNPSMFYSRDTFLKYEVNSYCDGYRLKYGGIKRPEQFKEKTKSFITRFTREEVMPDLPRINRQHQFVDVADAIADEFNRELEHYTELYDGSEENNIGKNHELRSSLFRLWHITGVAKIPAVADAVVEFLHDNPDKKIVIFKHHKDVGDILKLRIDAAIRKDEELSATTNPCLTLDSDTPERDTYAENSVKYHWFTNNPRDRVAIVSTRVGGEGWNLQSCEDMIMAERQWTPMDEEQCEGRFSRPGSTASSIFAQYFSAVGTIDDLFYSLVEQKRAWFHEAMSGIKNQDVSGINQSIMQELADALARHGRQKFSNR